MASNSLRRLFLTYSSCLVLILVALHLPATCYGETCDMRVEVSPYQVNIDAGGVAHYVRVLTYSWYSNTDQDSTFVFVDEGDALDPKDVVLTRDSVGHLVVKIYLEALQREGLLPGLHIIKIVAGLKETVGSCTEMVGLGELYILGKSGR